MAPGAFPEITDSHAFLACASRFASVLDVGCGPNGFLPQVRSPRRVGVDICQKAIDIARAACGHIEYHCHDLRDLRSLFSPNSFECVAGMDVLEHLKMDDSLRLLDVCEALATKCLMFFVPVGRCPYSQDLWNLDNQHHMTHKSTWAPEHLAGRGYEVWHFADWHKKHKGLQPGWSRAAIWCIKWLGEPCWRGSGVVHQRMRYARGGP